MILSYAPAAAREGLVALLALDDQLADVVRTTREAMVGQMRFTWWHGALTALDTAPPPAQPVLRALAAHVVPRVPGAMLAGMVEGWEELLDAGDAGEAGMLDRYAAGRGGTLFATAARLVGPEDARVRVAGEGWALADLAGRARDSQLAARARAAGNERLRGLTAARWSRALRPVSAMALLARMPEATPAARIGRILLHRLTGK
ncbi:squalene/phytoene synthase family protein [Sphingomonas donggukensis]|uniref:Squalene/phytoene synthase family protein n=1 Tax=Sphingomonas donggukensis TaxID=2949093 RepID=A0ABY4TZ33_9SPHN|nr:squalene/phytoene synthase family protein [Sphingomonas donggukensis]URW76812.1 squalene/phytoene synthase family protein [Sphingomonas donggukensis]